jgi:hypothetical protein
LLVLDLAVVAAQAEVLVEQPAVQPLRVVHRAQPQPVQLL